MRTEGTFSVETFAPTELAPEPAIATGVPVSVIRSEEHFAIVPGSGTGDLTGIAGTGGMTVEADGTHRIWFEHELGG